MNINPILVCAYCRSARLHIFVERRPQRRDPGDVAYVDLIYACDRCGGVRAWGSEPREATAQGRRLADTTFAHAVDMHGMRRQDCPACRGVGLDCAECGDNGQVWVFDSLEPCGPSCPLAGLGGLVAE